MILNLDSKNLLWKKFYKESCQYTRTLMYFATTKFLKISLSFTLLQNFIKKVLLQDMFLKLINLKILKGTLK